MTGNLHAITGQEIYRQYRRVNLRAITGQENLQAVSGQ